MEDSSLETSSSSSVVPFTNGNLDLSTGVDLARYYLTKSVKDSTKQPVTFSKPYYLLFGI